MVYTYGWYNLARVLLRLGKKDDALEACRRSLDINPNYSLSLNLIRVITTENNAGGN